jgi:hypothetical protein
MEMEASIGLYLDNNNNRGSYSITGVPESLYKYWKHHVYIYKQRYELYDPLHSLKTETIGTKKMTAKIAVVGPYAPGLYKGIKSCLTA